MSDRPSYLSLLNAIAVAEQRGGEVLSAWAAATSDRDLRVVLERVAIREREHAAAFRKRLCELGFGVREKPSEAFAAALACARSGAADAHKFLQILGYGGPRDEQPDPLSRIFEDASIDPQTGALLGRYIAEERDSERQLRAARERANGIAAATANGDLPAAEDAALLGEIAERIERLARTLEDLKQLRR